MKKEAGICLQEPITEPRKQLKGEEPDSFFRVSNSSDAAGRGTDYQYNNLDLPTQIKRSLGTGSLTTTLTYDEVGRTTSITDANGNLSQFYYDPATGDLLSTIQQLAAGTSTIDVISRYTYDRFGNVISVTDPNNVTTTFQYDELNRLIRVGKQQLQGATGGMLKLVETR